MWKGGERASLFSWHFGHRLCSAKKNVEMPTAPSSLPPFLARALCFITEVLVMIFRYQAFTLTPMTAHVFFSVTCTSRWINKELPRSKQLQMLKVFYAHSHSLLVCLLVCLQINAGALVSLLGLIWGKFIVRCFCSRWYSTNPSEIGNLLTMKWEHCIEIVVVSGNPWCNLCMSGSMAVGGAATLYRVVNPPTTPCYSLLPQCYTSCSHPTLTYPIILPHFRILYLKLYWQR